MSADASRENDAEGAPDEEYLSANLESVIRSVSVYNDAFKVKLEWKDVTYTVESGKRGDRRTITILDHISGHVNPGEIVALMGSSGSGKTTLLNALAGRIKEGKITGDIRANNMARNSLWRHVVGYLATVIRRFVDQDDMLSPFLTVREVLRFAARLRLPRRMSKSQKYEIVERIIMDLGLIRVADSCIGDETRRGISGGERKRVCIGIELVSNPKLMFLDEPTTGLDAFTSQSLVDTLHTLAHKDKRAILLTIHQPRRDIFFKLDRIIILSKGNVIFSGTTQEAINHFMNLGYPVPQRQNPADFFLDTCTIDYRSEQAKTITERRMDTFVKRWGEDGTKEPDFATREPGAAVSSKSHRNKWGERYPIELYLLLKRNFVANSRNPRESLALFFQSLFMGLLLGFIFFQLSDDQVGIQNRVGLLFFIILNNTFSTMAPLLALFPTDRAIITRERYSATYNASSAYLGKWGAAIPIRILTTVVFIVPVYWIAGLNPGASQFFIALTLLWCIMIAGVSIGMVIGALSPSIQMSQIFGPLVILLFALFGGYFSSSSNVTWILRWLQYISPIFYAFQALMTNEFQGETFSCTPGQPCMQTGEQVLTTFHITFSIIACIGLIFAISLVLNIIGLIGLSITTRPRMSI